VGVVHRGLIVSFDCYGGVRSDVNAGALKCEAVSEILDVGRHDSFAPRVADGIGAVLKTGPA
jgi:hypothetical protein